MPENKTYGRTKSGVEITDELIEQYVTEAEEGLDLSKLRPRGRPRMGKAPAKSFPVRLDPELREELDRASEARGVPASEIVRSALRAFLSADHG